MQRGAVLLFALVFLGLLAMLVAAVSEIHVLQLRLGPHLEAQLRARQASLGRIEDVLTSQGRAVPQGAPGTRHCAEGSVLPACDSFSLGEDGVARAYIEVLQREGAVPPRVRESLASSAVAYQAMQYEVVATAREGAARAQLHQGILLLYPRGRDG